MFILDERTVQQNAESKVTVSLDVLRFVVLNSTAKRGLYATVLSIWLFVWSFVCLFVCMSSVLSQCILGLFFLLHFGVRTLRTVVTVFHTCPPHETPHVKFIKLRRRLTRGIYNHATLVLLRNKWSLTRIEQFTELKLIMYAAALKLSSCRICNKLLFRFL